ncbi:methyl-accepting chemotaxis protein [Reinekea sp. G2M2-21]|uniref:methyl-accepting chemotaxis protein n=1 Tax=Reinekea sp. G2M2-21 TaxID=2788942 RepID=UPI0018AB1720|nr:methyl-accepting chemotaxis protein [Reinekea sp. G2M2-21]
MKIRTQVSLTLGGMVLMLVVVAVGGYLAASVVNKAGSIIPVSLIPGVQNYNDMRYKTLEVVSNVYQGDFQKVAAISKPLRPRVVTFGTIAADSPFLGNKVLEAGLARISKGLLAVIDSAGKLKSGDSPSSEFVKAVAGLEGMEQDANEIIQYLIDQTTMKINRVIANIVRMLVGASVVIIALATVFGLILTRKLSLGLSSLQLSFRKISDGDLTTKANDSTDDEFGEIARYFNELATTLSSTISQLATMMNTLADLSSRFRESGAQFQERAIQTSDETQQVATAMTEMAATVREVAQNAEETSSQAKEASDQADIARDLVGKTVSSSKDLQQKMSGISGQMLELKEKTASISSVIDVIQGIAEQTNLLALNAAIEAARAGEQGRGFAVVADEVRSLATRTGQSTQEIVDVIKALQSMSETAASNIAQGQDSVESNAESIKNIEGSLLSILDSISTISNMNHQIATNAQEQSHVAEDMNANVVRISDLSEMNAKQTKQINDDIKTIDQLTSQVRQLIAKFQY